MHFSNIWIDKAASYLGVAEIPGAKNNEQILAFLHTVLDTDTEDTPWCAAFVNFNLDKVGIKSSGSGMARSFETSKRFYKLGDVPELYSGSICTRWRVSKGSGQGHVGFAVAKKPGYTAFLGGNQGDKVSVAWQPNIYITGFYYPVGFDFKPLTDAEKEFFKKLADSGSTKMT